MKSEIVISFCDWWEGFDVNTNFLIDAIKANFRYRITENPAETDFVFSSVFGDEYLKYDCPRIFFTGENCFPDFNAFDYAIGFEHLYLEDRYFRLPLYVLHSTDCERMMKQCAFSKTDLVGRDFCSIVVSNSKLSSDYRETLFDKLCNYKIVASGGRFRNNIGNSQGVENKQDFIKKYKFNIACENSSHSGYCTEKIVQAFSANVIPIYWGDPLVSEYFNPDSFINCNDFDSVEEVVEYVKEIDNDEKKYYAMLNAPKIVNEKYHPYKMKKNFENWIVTILKQDRENSYRRNLFGWNKGNEEMQKAKKEDYETLVRMKEKMMSGRISKMLFGKRIF